jgi:hypothetical protein
MSPFFKRYSSVADAVANLKTSFDQKEAENRGND